MAKPVKILSVDGGGIRGLIPAVLLAEMEERTGKPVCELFDLIAGTSTGGILALCLTVPDETGRPAHSARDLVLFFETEGERIFSRTVGHEIRALGHLADEKYLAEGLEAVLVEYLREARLKEALADVLVTSFEIERRMPWFFSSSLAKTQSSHDFLMRHVGRATSAAPTYFAPARVETDDATDYYALIDGGVIANNPAMCALVEAKKSHPEANDFLVVSLGTGQWNQRLPYDVARNWGLAQWARRMLGVVFDGASETVDYQLRHLLTPVNGKRRYYRFQGQLEPGDGAIDEVRGKHLRALRLAADDIISKSAELIDELCGQLVGSD